MRVWWWWCLSRISPPFPFSVPELTWPGLWSHSWGSGWFLAGVPGPNTNIPAELAPAPAYQKTDRKYESRRKTPWLTGRERGRGRHQSELSQVRRQAGLGLKGDMRVIRVTRQAGCFSPFLVGTLKWFIKKNVHYNRDNLPDVNRRKKIKIKFICHNNNKNWNIAIWPTFQPLRD